MGAAKVWNGTTWVDQSAKPRKVWNGTTWVDQIAKPVKYWNGTAWVDSGVSNGTAPFGFAGASSAAFTSTTPTNVTCNLPTGWVPGQLAIFAAAMSGAGGTITPPAGWTPLPSLPGMPVIMASSAHWIGYRVLQAGDIKPTLQGSTGVLKCVAGIVTYSTALLDVEAHAQETVNGATHTAPAATTTVADTIVVRVYLEKATTNTAWTDPSGGYTRRIQQLLTGTGACDLLVADIAQPSTGSTGTAAATSTASTAQALMATIALKSAV